MASEKIRAGISAQSAEEQNKTIEKYYKFQSKIYDLTRWSFLFGRKEVVKKLPIDRNAKIEVLEVGCGTGINLRTVAHTFPNAQLTGLDLSSDMLEIAKANTNSFSDRVKLIQQPYTLGETTFQNKDVILFSYSLTMINPQWEELIRQAYQDLKPGGFIAVADFHDSQFSWFKNHMSNHHVRMDSHLQPVLADRFEPVVNKAKAAYAGVWHYLVFIGRKAV